MRRLFLSILTALLASMLLTSTALAGNAHFVGDATIERVSDTELNVSGKVAGLGNETQITVDVSATAECVNPGNNKPKAANKQSVTASVDVPVQNGKADYSVALVAELSPNCSPPMTIVWSDVLVEVADHDIAQFYPGPS